MLSFVLACAVAATSLSQEPGATPAPGERAEEIIKAGVQLVLSRVLDVPVTVDGVAWNAESSSLEITGLEVANPSGFDAATAFSAGTVRLQADLKNLFSPTPTVQLIEMDGAEVNAESNLTRGSNLYLLMKSAREFSSKGPMSRFKGDKQWRIEKGILGATQVKIENNLLQRYSAEKTIGPIEMEFPGPNGQGLPAQEAVAQFLNRLISELGTTDGQPPTESPAKKLLPKLR